MRRRGGTGASSPESSRDDGGIGASAEFAARDNHNLPRNDAGSTTPAQDDTDGSHSADGEEILDQNNLAGLHANGTSDHDDEDNEFGSQDEEESVSNDANDVDTDNDDSYGNVVYGENAKSAAVSRDSPFRFTAHASSSVAKRFIPTVTASAATGPLAWLGNMFGSTPRRTTLNDSNDNEDYDDDDESNKQRSPTQEPSAKRLKRSKGLPAMRIHQSSTSTRWKGKKDIDSAINDRAPADICCPICQDTFSDAYMTKCGHSYCYACITTHFRVTNNCPVCSAILRPADIFPNVLLNKLIDNHFHKNSTIGALGSKDGGAQAVLKKRSAVTLQKGLDQNWSVDEIDDVVSTLMEKRKNLEARKKVAELMLLKNFIGRIKREKEEEAERLRRMIDILSADLDYVTSDLEAIDADNSEGGPKATPSASFASSISDVILNTLRLTPRVEKRKRLHSEMNDSLYASADQLTASQSSEVHRQQKILDSHLSDLRQTYFNMRMANTAPPLKQSDTRDTPISDTTVTPTSQSSPTSLAAFSSILGRMSQYSKFRTLSHIYHADRILSGGTVTTGGTGSSSSSSNSCIISSIDFDRDDEMFATAGVAKKIRVYNYKEIVADLRRDGRGNARFGGGGGASGGFITAREDGRRRRLAENLGYADGDSEDIIASDFLQQPNDVGNDPLAEDLDGVMRFPVAEMAWKAKISCISWSPDVKALLASSDYEGGVALWDAISGTSVVKFEEHQKRTWSVEFNRGDPNLLASGGDDSKVKIWARNQQSSLHCIETKANICSVKWNPSSPFELSFGSADHKVYLYDLRNISSPLYLLTGHSRAVSYVQFISRKELVSASTDSTLRLWDLNADVIAENLPQSPRVGNNGFSVSSAYPYSPAIPTTTPPPPPPQVTSAGGVVVPPVSPQWRRTFSSHRNEKNFVGLSVNSTGDFIACGSETNSVYAYHRGLSQAVISQSFGRPIDPIHGFVSELDDPSHFVTSVCWKRRSPDILAVANSQGRVKILQMV